MGIFDKPTNVFKGRHENIRPVDISDPSSGFSSNMARQDHKHRLDPDSVVVTRLYDAILNNGTQTIPFLWDSHLSILGGPTAIPVTMIVTAIGYVGFNAATNQTIWHVVDELGNLITLPAGGVTIDNYNAGFWRACSIMGTKTYAVGATPGFHLGYQVSASNVYARMGVRVDIMPAVYTS